MRHFTAADLLIIKPLIRFILLVLFFRFHTNCLTGRISLSVRNYDLLYDCKFKHGDKLQIHRACFVH